MKVCLATKIGTGFPREGVVSPGGFQEAVRETSARDGTDRFMRELPEVSFGPIFSSSVTLKQHQVNRKKIRQKTDRH